jgi:predicted component of type VI protein secretion system
VLLSVSFEDFHPYHLDRESPGISETLDWAEALLKLHRDVLDQETVEQTLGCILKYREDIQKFKSTVWADPHEREPLLQDPPQEV